MRNSLFDETEYSSGSQRNREDRRSCTRLSGEEMAESKEIDTHLSMISSLYEPFSTPSGSGNADAS